jgi:hypothetical protein
MTHESSESGERMNRSYHYARQKLSSAVEILATGPGDIRSRLMMAFLECAVLRTIQFPPELQSDWQWIRDQLTKHEPILRADGRVRKGSVEVTLSRMRNHTGSKIAKRIFDLSSRLQEGENNG